MSSAHSRSDADAFDAAIDAVAADVLGRVAPLTRPLVLIDGRSGSGKTTLAARLAERWGAPVQVVALDDLYPGWDGLDAGVESMRTDVLAPLAAGADAVWRRWDWAAHGYAEQHVVAADTPVIVEGSGALTPGTARLADVTVWLESPEPSRRARALARDGDLYRPHWEGWAAQEATHLTRDHPAALATVRAEIP